jgi:hypothetical protein
MRRAFFLFGAPWEPKGAWTLDGSQSAATMSSNRQLLSKNASVGEYQRNIPNQPLPGAVWIQLAAFVGLSAPKAMSIDPPEFTVGLV